MLLLVADVVDHVPAGERGACRPQRVVGRGDQDLVAVVQERLHDKVDELGCPVAGVDVFHVHIGDALELVVLHDGLARTEQPAALGIALAVDELVLHVLDDFVWRAEPKGRGVSYVELEHVDALVRHAVCLVEDRAAHIVEHVVELRGLLEGAHGGSFRRFNFCLGLFAGLGLRAALGFRGGLRLRLRGCAVGAEQPFRRGAEHAGECEEHGLARYGFAAHILAELAFSQLEAVAFRECQKVDLLEPLRLHGLFQTRCERLVGHAVSSKKFNLN